MIQIGVAGTLGFIVATVYAILHTIVPAVYYMMSATCIFALGTYIWWGNFKSEPTKMKLKNIQASVYDKGGGELQVWGVSFIIPGTMPRDANGRIPESAYKNAAKRIKKLLEQIDYPHEEKHPNDD